MKYIFLLLLGIIINETANGQTSDIDTAKASFVKRMTEIEKNQKFVTVAPQYPGGYEFLYDYLKANVVVPPAAKKAGKNGEVIIYCIIDQKDGHVRDAKIKYSTDKIFNAAALEAIKKMPNWSPAMLSLNSDSVNCGQQIPIRFTSK